MTDLQKAVDALRESLQSSQGEAQRATGRPLDSRVQRKIAANVQQSTEEAVDPAEAARREAMELGYADPRGGLNKAWEDMQKSLGVRTFRGPGEEVAPYILPSSLSGLDWAKAGAAEFLSGVSAGTVEPLLGLYGMQQRLLSKLYPGQFREMAEGVAGLYEGAREGVRSALAGIAEPERKAIRASAEEAKKEGPAGRVAGVLMADLPSAMGSVSTYLTGGYAAGTKAVLALGMSQASTENFYEAKAAGAPEWKQWVASLAGAGVGALEVAGIGRVGRALTKSGRTDALQTLMYGRKAAVPVRAAGVALEESLAEGAAQALTNLTARGLWDPERGFGDGVTDAMIVGAVTGTAVGAPTAAYGVSAERAEEREQAAEVAEEARQEAVEALRPPELPAPAEAAEPEPLQDPEAPAVAFLPEGSVPVEGLPQEEEVVQALHEDTLRRKREEQRQAMDPTPEVPAPWYLDPQTPQERKRAKKWFNRQPAEVQEWYRRHRSELRRKEKAERQAAVEAAAAAEQEFQEATEAVDTAYARLDQVETTSAQDLRQQGVIGKGAEFRTKKQAIEALTAQASEAKANLQALESARAPEVEALQPEVEVKPTEVVAPEPVETEVPEGITIDEVEATSAADLRQQGVIGPDKPWRSKKAAVEALTEALPKEERAARVLLKANKAAGGIVEPEEGSQLAAVRDFMGKRGLPVVFVRQEDGEALSRPGMYMDGVAVLDAANPAESLRRVAYHEVAHHMKRAHGNTWKDLHDDIRRADRAGLRAARQRYFKLARKQRVPIESAEVGRDEATAKYIEDIGAYIDMAFADPQRLQRLAARNPTMVRRIAEAVRNFLASIGLGRKSRYAQDLQALRRITDVEVHGDPKKLSQIALRVREAMNEGMGLDPDADIATARFALAPRKATPAANIYALADDPYAGHRRKMAVQDTPQEQRFALGSPHGWSADIEREAAGYRARHGIGQVEEREWVPVNEARAKRIAQAFDDARDQPDDPKVRRAYEALASETRDQYDYLVARGMRFIPYEGDGEPYPNSEEVVRDIRENRRHLYFKTIQEGVASFGEDPDATGSPLLEDADRPVLDSKGNEYRQTFNDLLRAVHDYFGHAMNGSTFGPRGEENAWRAHMRMYSPLAGRALTTEFRGQNSWVNYGPHTLREDGSIPRRGESDWVHPANRPYADQKVTLLPSWISRVRVEKFALVDPVELGALEPRRSYDGLGDLKTGHLLRVLGGELVAGVDLISDGVATKRKAWIEAMLQRFGPGIKPHLSKLYTAALLRVPPKPGQIGVVPKGRRWAVVRGRDGEILSLHPNRALAAIRAKFYSKGKVPRPLVDPDLEERIAGAGHRMQVVRGKRKVISKSSVQLSAKEKDVISKAAKFHKVSERALTAYVRDVKSKHATSHGWMDLKLDSYNPKKQKENKSQSEEEKLAKTVKWESRGYTFHRDKKTKRDDNDTHEARTSALARRVVKDVREIVEKAKAAGQADLSEAQAAESQAALVALRQRRWYSNMVDRLYAEFGSASEVFVDLLGALSPNTTVKQNFNFAVSALKQFVRGEFDSELDQFQQHLLDGGSKSNYDGPKILQRSGKLYGMNSLHAMEAMLVARWRLANPGSAPKAKNFSWNLAGWSVDATIDLWAARYLQRLSGNRRVPPAAEQSIGGNWSESADVVTGQFGFAQEVFEKAAVELGLNASDLQAMVWFSEKAIWTKNDWTTKDGEGGSFEEMLDRMQTDRWIAGITIHRDERPLTPERAGVITDTLAMLKADDSVVAYRAPVTAGVFMWGREPSYDMELTALRGWDPASWIDNVRQIAEESEQDGYFVARALRNDESAENAAPGLEVRFSRPVDSADADRLVQRVLDAGFAGAHLMRDPRRMQPRQPKESLEPPQEFIGLRVLWVEQWAGPGETQLDAKTRLSGLQKTLEAETLVQTAARRYFDLRVEEKGKDYGDRARSFEGRVAEPERERARPSDGETLGEPDPLRRGTRGDGVRPVDRGPAGEAEAEPALFALGQGRDPRTGRWRKTATGLEADIRRAREEGETTEVGAGRRPLAERSDDPDVRALGRAITEERDRYYTPERIADWEVKAKERLDRDYSGERDRLLQKIEEGGALDEVETLMMDQVKTDAAMRALKTGSSEAQALAIKTGYLYQDARTKAAKALTAIRDSQKSAREKIADIMALPNRSVRRRLKKLKKRIDALESEKRGLGVAFSLDQQADLDNLRDQVEAVMKAEAKENAKVQQRLTKAGFPPSMITNDYFKDPATWATISRIITTTKSSKWDWFLEFRIASMLSGPLTHMRNIVGNAAFHVLEQHVTRIAEAAANTVIRDKNSASFGEVVEFYRNYIPALLHASRIFAKSLQTDSPVWDHELQTRGYSLERAGTSKIEVLRRRAIPGKLGQVTRGSLSLLTAEDQFFKSLAAITEGHALAWRAATAEGLTGEARRLRAADILEDVHHPIHEQRLYVAAKVTFTDAPGPLLEWVQSGRNVADDLLPGGAPVGSILLPFVNTPGKIFQRGLELPMHPVVGLYRLFTGQYRRQSRRDPKTGRYRTVSENRARLAEDTGRSLVSIGVALSILAMVFDDDENGLPRITGSSSRKSRKLDDRTAPAYSLRVGDEYYSYRNIEPAAVTLATLVDGMWRYRKEVEAGGGITDSAAASLQSVVQGIPQQATDKTFLRTIGELYDAVTEENVGGQTRLSRMLRDTLVTPMIPNIIRSSARSEDPYYRESRDRRQAEASASEAIWTSGFLYQIFPTRHDLLGKAPPPKRDVWGRPIKRPGNSTLWRMINPVPVTKEIKDISVLDLAIRNYNDKVQRGEFPDALPFYPRRPDYFAGSGKDRVYFSEAEYDRLLQESGERASKRLMIMVRDKRINVTNPTPKQMDRMNKILSEERSKARRRVLNARL